MLASRMATMKRRSIWKGGKIRRGQGEQAAARHARHVPVQAWTTCPKPNMPIVRERDE